MGLWVVCEFMQRTVNMNRTPSYISMYNNMQRKKTTPKNIMPKYVLTFSRLDFYMCCPLPIQIWCNRHLEIEPRHWLPVHYLDTGRSLSKTNKTSKILLNLYVVK